MPAGETRARMDREDDEEEAREAAWWRIAGTTAERRRLMRESIHGRPVVGDVTPEEAARRSANERARSQTRSAAGEGVLRVGDLPDTAKDGGRS